MALIEEREALDACVLSLILGLCSGFIVGMFTVQPLDVKASWIMDQPKPKPEYIAPVVLSPCRIYWKAIGDGITVVTYSGDAEGHQDMWEHGWREVQ